ncbi:glycosyltransferase family 90 protein [Periconia macrospinosa]|uniref:Glycosyltransferase family 90 protein n=1 Tax=Periconia macrospinosa TaxID=97972 RepID=A0A2V1DDX4_9PLEO|nr:glycosyltransferase family 90 protein [Periconia macrospinosa]
MHPVALLIVDNARKHQSHIIPAFYVLFAKIAFSHAPVQHQLLIAAASWGIVCLLTLLWAGISLGSDTRRNTAWLAGGFLALAYICDSAACDKEGIWSTKGLLPLLVTLLSESELLSKHSAPPNLNTAIPDPKRPTKSFLVLCAATVSASIVLSTQFTAPATSALGISSIIFTATGLVLFSSSLKLSNGEMGDAKNGTVSNKDNSLSTPSSRLQLIQNLVVLRDVAAVIAVTCGISACFFEPRISPHRIAWPPDMRNTPQGPGGWKTLHYHRTVRSVLSMICINTIVHILTFVMINQEDAIYTSFLSVCSYIGSRLNLATSASGIWFTMLYVSSFLFLTSLSPSSTSTFDIRTSIRFKRLIVAITAVSVAYTLIQHTIANPKFVSSSPKDAPFVFDAVPPKDPLQPVPMDWTQGHGASRLIATAEQEFDQLVNAQSKSLSEAARNYRLRNGIAPPPHFDKWYEFATRNGVVLIDEFDTITQSLLPFWAVKPSTIRARIRYALGHEDSALLGIMIRGGAVVKVEGGPQWQQEATVGMLDSFVKYLPDMDLGFNIHDEPRVVVPNDQLSAMVAAARDLVLPVVGKKESPRNSFSPRPFDVNDGKRFEESSNTRFNRFAHQQTWTHARLSCPAYTQAQQFEDQIPDNMTAYAAGLLGYVYNQTAFSDICNSPSFSSSFGFFERPNAFNIIHELTPIFSQSKISTFQDILFPSPWYYVGKVGYDEARDTTWENKTNSLYWRGSTTGGFSRNGGWRRQHRQRVVRRLNAPDKAKIFVPDPTDTSPTPAYAMQTVERRDYDSLVDVKFSHIGQCDPGDCDAQNEFFKVTERVDGQDAWYFKHLLDMDGNAFSGRFYSFLKSRSLVYKMAIFREWHQEWLKPWVHYVPLSLHGDEHLDLVQWFAGGEAEAQALKTFSRSKQKQAGNKGGNGNSEGERKAREIAERSREWAGKVLRNVDFEVWFFRLLLEYGRVIDDDRENIGYPGP